MNLSTNNLGMNTDTPIYLPKNLLLWIMDNITCPIAGFEHKRKGNGEYFSYDQQLKETYYQVMLIATYYYKKGASTQRIISILDYFKR